MCKHHWWDGGKGTGQLWLFVLTALFVSAALAQEPVTLLDTWEEAGVGAWTGGTPQATLSNPGGYLGVGFKAQSAPAFVAVTVRRTMSSVLLTNISFRVTATEAPSALRLCFHSTASDTVWCLVITPPAAGNWTTVDVPLEYDAGWSIGPLRSRAQFNRDVLNIDWVGVYVRRSGSCAAHSVMIDDFLVNGLAIPGSVSLSGTVAYSGEQAGQIHVSALPLYGGLPQSGTMDTPGDFTLPGVSPLSEYRVTAYRDSNSNEVRDAWEAVGTGTPDPVASGLSGVAGIAVTLSDPVGENNVPLWWIFHHFGLPDAGGGSGTSSWADGDEDNDGLLNYAEYVAGTDPTSAGSALEVSLAATNEPAAPDEIVVTWPAVPGRIYSVRRATDLLAGFVRIASNIPATSPVNRYVDRDINPALPHFYRIDVTH